MFMKQVPPDKIVADGVWRLRSAKEAEVRQTVEAKYAQEWKKCGFYARLWLRARIEREVWRELKKAVPRHALYLQSVRLPGPFRPRAG
jgi:hypothetical protein